MAATRQQAVGCFGEPASATDEDTLASTGVLITVKRVEEQIAGAAQGGEVSRHSTAVGVGGACRLTERAAQVLLSRVGTDIEELAGRPRRRERRAVPLVHGSAPGGSMSTC
jgi:hypothetical protein